MFRHATHANRCAARDPRSGTQDLLALRRRLLACQGSRRRLPARFSPRHGRCGWLGIAMPEAYGGSGLGITEAAVMRQAVAESGAAFAGASALHMNIFGLNPVVVFGTEEQKQRFLPPLIKGDEKACFAVTEPDAGLDTTKLKTRAVRDGNQPPRARPEDLDIDGAGGRAGAAAGPHHAARAGQEADAGAVAVLHRAGPASRRGARDRMMGRKTVELRPAVLRWPAGAGRGPHRRGGARLRVHPARHEPRAHPDRRGRRSAPDARPCSGRRNTPGSASSSTDRSARTRRSSIRWPSAGCRWRKPT